MRARFLIAFGAALLIAGASFAAPKESELPRQILNARYVAIVALGAGAAPQDQFSPGLDPDDRRAIVDVEQALRKWGRYSIAMNVKDADLLIAVRTARRGSVTIGGDIGAGSQGRSHGSIVSTEVGPNVDLMYVIAGTSLDAPVLWQSGEHDGLQGKTRRCCRNSRATSRPPTKKCSRKRSPESPNNKAAARATAFRILRPTSSRIP